MTNNTRASPADFTCGPAAFSHCRAAELQCVGSQARLDGEVVKLRNVVVSCFELWAEHSWKEFCWRRFLEKQSGLLEGL